MAVHQQNAVLLTGAGGVDENLVLGHIDKPTPAAGQVLVKIKATALNPVDWKMAKYARLSWSLIYYFISVYKNF